MLLVLGITLPMVGPSFSKRIADLRSEAALRQIVTLLAEARQEALLMGRPVTVCAIDTTGNCNRVWGEGHRIVVFRDKDKDRKPGAGDSVLREITWPMEQAELSWRASLARPYLVFEETGGTWQNGTLYYCPASRDARQARALVLSHSGRSYLTVDSNGDGLREDRKGKNLRCF